MKALKYIIFIVEFAMISYLYLCSHGVVLSDKVSLFIWFIYAVAMGIKGGMTLSEHE